MRQRPLGRLTLPFVKASPEAQLRLLELADLDAELGRLDHRRRTLPENAELDQLTERAAKVRDAITIADTDLADLDRDLSRAEKDVDQVRVRIERDNQRLTAGQVSNARELESLQSEVVSLRKRQGDLEEVVLELMERRETSQTLRDGSAAEAETVGADMAALTARRDAALAEINEQAEKATAARATVVPDVPADLLGRAAPRPVRRLPGDAVHGRAERDPCRRPGRGGPARGVPPDPGQDPRVWSLICKDLPSERGRLSRSRPSEASSVAGVQ